jgi:hypothetical protein
MLLVASTAVDVNDMGIPFLDHDGAVIHDPDEQVGMCQLVISYFPGINGLVILPEKRHAIKCPEEEEPLLSVRRGHIDTVFSHDDKLS